MTVEIIKCNKCRKEYKHYIDDKDILPFETTVEYCDNCYGFPRGEFRCDGKGNVVRISPEMRKLMKESRITAIASTEYLHRKIIVDQILTGKIKLLSNI